MAHHCSIYKPHGAFCLMGCPEKLISCLGELSRENELKVGEKPKQRQVLGLE